MTDIEVRVVIVSLTGEAPRDGCQTAEFHVYICVYIYIYVHIYICIYICVYTDVRTYTYIYIYIHTHTLSATCMT